MGMIFPGMDPYLEHPQLWTGVHSRLVVYLADQLQPQLQPRYLASVEERVFIEGPPRWIVPDVWVRESRAFPLELESSSAVAIAEADAAVLVEDAEGEVHESYIEILDLHSGQKVVTVIEVVSPSNKFGGPGRDSYLSKQTDVRSSTAHLVEIDLLRTGHHVLAVPQWAVRARRPYDYLVSVNRAKPPRKRFETYPTVLRQRLPRIRVPLAEGDPDVLLDLQAAVARVYDSGAYAARIDYQKPCEPPLAEADQAWAWELARGPT